MYMYYVIDINIVSRDYFCKQGYLVVVFYLPVFFIFFSLVEINFMESVSYVWC